MNNKTKLTLAVITAIIIASVVAISPVAAQGDIDTSNLEIGDISAPDEADLGEEVEFGSSAEIPDLPANWFGEFEFTLYIDESQVETQEISIEDGESTDVSISHQLQEDGNKEVYFEISGELTREGALSEQSVDVDRTTQTVTIEVIDDGADDDDNGIIGGDDDTDDDDNGIIGGDDDGIIDDGPELDSVSVEGAAFVAPDTIQNDVDEVRDTIPQNAGPHSFVLTSTDEHYVVIADEKPQEGHATVEGFTPLDADLVETNEFDFEVVVATDVEFDSPSSVSVSEVAQNPDTYDREFVQISAHHRNIGIDYKRGPPVSTGVLVADPLETGDLFGSVGSNARSTLDEDFDSNNVESALGQVTQDRVVTASFGAEEYWTNGEVTISGITAAPNTPARDFIESFRDENILPADSNTPVMYVVEEEYNAEEVSGISEISENAAEFDGELVTVESNFLQTRISTERVFYSATGTPLPVDTILHGGAAWDQIPDNRDDVMLMMAASSVEQPEYQKTRTGTYQITGEVISTDRIEGNLPDGSILVIYDLERVGSLDTAADDIIENQASGVSDTLENQADPDVDASQIEEETDDLDETDETDDLDETDETDDLDETDDEVTETENEPEATIGDVVDQVDESESEVQAEVEIESTDEDVATDETTPVVDTSEQTESVEEIRFDEKISGSVNIEEYNNEDVIETTAESIERTVSSELGNDEEADVEVFSVSRITVDQSDTGATVTMSVDSDKIDEPQEAVIYHETNAGWEELPTEVEEVHDDEIILSGDTDGFSLFAVGQVDTGAVSESDDGISIAILFFAVTGLAIILAPVVVVVLIGVFLKRKIIG